MFAWLATLGVVLQLALGAHMLATPRSAQTLPSSATELTQVATSSDEHDRDAHLCPADCVACGGVHGGADVTRRAFDLVARSFDLAVAAHRAPSVESRAPSSDVERPPRV